MIRRHIAAGFAGGLLAGAAVGAVEALAVWFHAHGAGELPALAWAVVVYGALGAAGGIGAGIVAALLGTDGFALALAGVLAGLGFVVARFRVIRDVFLEQAPHGPLAAAVQLGALVAIVVAAVMIWRTLRGASARRAPAVAVALVVVLAVAGGIVSRLRSAPAPRPAAVATPAPAGVPNVVVVMMDTLRADRLGCYGSSVKTPRIDGLAREGLRFANTFAQASWTRPSTATILTGLYPSSHGAVHKADLLPDRVDTVAEMLQRMGYQTVGFANNVNVSPVFNFQQGYEDYRYLAPDMFFGADEQAAQLALYGGLRLVRERFLSRYVDVRNYYWPAEAVTAEVSAWLAGRGNDPRPFFAFVHYMDAHDPYMEHPYNGVGYARVAMPNPPREMAEKLARAYDGAVEHLDQHFGALLDALEARGVYDRTLVIVTADHGEEFHEHGGWWHGTTLYDEQIHVPLIMKPAGAKHPGRVVEEFATHLDIVPTILSAAGLSLPTTLQGHVLPLDGDPAPARQSVFSEENFEGNVLQAVRTSDWKFVTANPENPRGLAPEELYDLPEDKGERQNVVAQKAGPAEQMRAELGKSVLQARAYAGESETATMDDATNDRLRSLGYVGDSAGASPTTTLPPR